MKFVPVRSTSLIAFVWILAFILTSFLTAVYIACKRAGVCAAKGAGLVALGIFAWLFIFSFLAAGGYLAAAPMPLVPAVFILSNILAIILGMSGTGKLLAREIPIPALVVFQGFRLPLELLLHQWALSGTIPSTMTWTGANFDLVSGALALISAPFTGKYRSVAWFTNVVGFLLLMNVVRVAVLSSPLPFAWPIDPPLQLVFHFPYCLIVPVCIGGALVGHVILTRALLRI
jgi:hypothetical protein